MTDLERFRDHCRAMAEKVDQSGQPCYLGTDRDLWLMLADEIDDYLSRGHDHDQPMLGDT